MKTITLAIATLALSAAAVHADNAAKKEIKTANSGHTMNHSKKIAKVSAVKAGAAQTSAAQTPVGEQKTENKSDVK